MSPHHRRPSILGVLLVALVSVAVMAAGAGYLIGLSQRDDRVFTVRQQEYLAGLVAGTSLRNDHLPLARLRSTCAGTFYPDRPVAMAGCVAGLSNPPEGGYRLPPG